VTETPWREIGRDQFEMLKLDPEVTLKILDRSIAEDLDRTFKP
jgi:hypothetical protein